MRIKVNIPWIDVEYSETNPLIVIYVYMFGDRYQVFRFASVSMMTLSSQFLSASSDERNFRFNSVLLSHSDASSLWMNWCRLSGESRFAMFTIGDGFGDATNYTQFSLPPINLSHVHHCLCAVFFYIFSFLSYFVKCSTIWDLNDFP